MRADARAVMVQRNGLRAVAAFVDSRPGLFPTNRVTEVRLLRREEKEVVWSTWQRFLDYQVSLESLERAHGGYLRLRGVAKEDSYTIGHTAMVARYRAALEFIERMENNPEFHKVLNDPVPELGLPGGTYSKLRAFHYAGRPYDFNFDFSTDAELVCTELVYKSYEPAKGFTGLTFPLVEMLGRFGRSTRLVFGTANRRS